jgi:transcriptional regulator GlxA family with amidase domain
MKKIYRSDHVMERGEYLSRAREFAKRGQELPQTKLLDLDVAAIRSAQRQRQNLLKHIRENLSNEALAKQFNVSVRTIERITAYETWSHVA